MWDRPYSISSSAASLLDIAPPVRGQFGMATRSMKAARAAPNGGEERVLALMKRVQYRCYLRIEQALAPLGVAEVQYRLMATLKNRKEMSAAELSRLYEVRPQTMFKQIALMESKGLIRRAASKTNKRVLELELSEKGLRVLAECDARAAAIEEKLFRSFSRGELAIYRELMMRMLKAVRARTAVRGQD
jgi:DNA-binding MarR family transcriptional regulator